VTSRASTFSWSAVGASLLVPLVSLVWFVMWYDFTNPDGTQDNAMVHSFPFLLIFGLVCALPAQLCFYVLGRLQLARARPSILLAAGFSLALAAPVPVMMLFVILTDPADSLADREAGAAVSFLFVWICILVGAAVQFYRMRDSHAEAAERERSGLAC
jgi:hypothetical protein